MALTKTHDPFDLKDATDIAYEEVRYARIPIGGLIKPGLKLGPNGNTITAAQCQEGYLTIPVKRLSNTTNLRLISLIVTAPELTDAAAELARNIIAGWMGGEGASPMEGPMIYSALMDLLTGLIGLMPDVWPAIVQEASGLTSEEVDRLFTEQSFPILEAACDLTYGSGAGMAHRFFPSLLRGLSSKLSGLAPAPVTPPASTKSTKRSATTGSRKASSKG